MNVMQLRDAIVKCYPSRQPLMAWGAPGLGKSSAVAQAAEILRAQVKELNKAERKGVTKDEGFELIDLRLPLLEPVDLRGLPHVTDGVANWSRPSFLPTKGRGILFLDELVQAVPSMQAAASQLVLDRRIGDYRLPDGWHVVAAGNRLSDRSASNAMPRMMANRFVHLYVEVSVDAWVQWALKAQLDVRVIAYIKWRPDNLHKFDPQARVEAFTSPRSWEFVSKLIGSIPVNDPMLPEMIKGAIGEMAAAEFVGFIKAFDKMPSIDAILVNPGTAPIPTEAAIRYAATTALAARATKDNLHHLVVYFNRLTDEAQAPEYSVAAMKMVLGRDATLGNTKAFIAWAAKHNEVLV